MKTKDTSLIMSWYILLE